MTQEFIHSILLIKTNIIYPSIKHRYIAKDRKPKQRNVLKKNMYIYFLQSIYFSIFLIPTYLKF